MQFNFHLLPFHFLLSIFSLIRPHLGFKHSLVIQFAIHFRYYWPLHSFACTSHHKIHCECCENVNDVANVKVIWKVVSNLIENENERKKKHEMKRK